MARNNDRSRGSKRAPAAASLRPRRGKPKVCVFCRDSIPWVDYKDANLLGRFLSERAKIKARRTTGNCNRHQREVAVAIKTARELALLPYAKRTVAERLGGRGGRGGRGGPGGPGGGRPREDREERSEAPAGVEASAETTDAAVGDVEDLTAGFVDGGAGDPGAGDTGAGDDEV
jgi:small subunit ribosomal protein S18